MLFGEAGSFPLVDGGFGVEAGGEIFFVADGGAPGVYGGAVGGLQGVEFCGGDGQGISLLGEL